MWTAILGALAAVLPAILKLFGGGDKTAEQARELGRAEQQNADMKGGIETIRAAEKAARKVTQEETGDEPDPMDRARR